MPPQHLQGVGDQVTATNGYFPHLNAASEISMPMASPTLTSSIENPFSKPNLRTKDILQLSSADMDQLELAEATPRNSQLYDPASPRIPLRNPKDNDASAGNVSGSNGTGRESRRPLSVISTSSLNSDYSPGLDLSPGLISGVVPNLSPGTSHVPELLSPGRHRRHRSVLGGGIDYRTQHYHSYNGYQVYNGYNNNGYNVYSTYQTGPQSSQHLPNLQAPYQNQMQLMASQSTPHINSHVNCLPSSHATPHATSHVNLHINPNVNSSTNPNKSRSHSSSNHSSPFLYQDGFSQHSPPFDPLYSPSSNPADLSAIAASTQGILGTVSYEIQEVLVALAYKERQVLEAKQTWEAAKDDLATFRRQLNAMLAPEPEPVLVPSRSSIISRRHQPNVGVHALQYYPSSSSTPHKHRQRVVSWKIDNEVPTLTQPANMDEVSDDDEHQVSIPPRKCGVAFQIVNCLLDFVHCIISTLPVHQRDFRYEPRRIYWHPEYPTPMDSLFGHLSYE